MAERRGEPIDAAWPAAQFSMAAGQAAADTQHWRYHLLEAMTGGSTGNP